MDIRIKTITCVAALGALALFCSGAAIAQVGAPPAQSPNAQPGQPYPHQMYPDNTNTAPDQAGTNAMADSDFAKDAAQGGMAEVKLGQLAQEKGSSDAVKDFGKRMVQDHTEANDKLKHVASDENMNLPTGLSKKDQRTYDRLSQLSGSAFDRAYARDMVRDHETDIAAFQREAQNGQNNAIKDFASQTLPTLQDHLKMAREMEKTVGATSKSSAGGSQ
jgi:putative membrane protein